MKLEKLLVDNIEIQVYSYNTVVVGSGAAGLNAADRLFTYGQKDIAIISEGMNMGTSRNTGSDKQTYYKLTLAGDEKDSIFDMAQMLYQGGSMDGDIALVEAALSPQAFYHLVDIGVPFPFNKYGAYVGYKTDHDSAKRATSAGPLTSKFMTEKLEEQVKQKGICCFDGYQVIAILVKDNKMEKEAVGVLALNLNEIDNEDKRYVIFNCVNIVYATGGPAGIYATSVYPNSQTGATGIALEAGVVGKNLTESQYGIASTAFKWNLSGTYQQVLPRYLSVNRDGTDEREFLEGYFDNPGQMLDAIFLKGYQWPFDPRKTKDGGSSIIDLLVYNETIIKGRKVFLDYTRNPSWGSKKGNLNFNNLCKESYEYLESSTALFGNPIDRLKHMNQPAIELYLNNGIDLNKEYLEIAVCAQHNNGGLSANLWWESNIKHFFPVGEVNGTHGVYRPGGSALNSGQVGSIRAAQFISNRYRQEPCDAEELLKMTSNQILEKIEFAQKLQNQIGQESNILEIRKEIGLRMSKSGAHIRNLSSIRESIEETLDVLTNLDKLIKLESVYELPYAFQNRDLLITQLVYLTAIEDYIIKGGGSRGSYLINDIGGDLPLENLPEIFRHKLDKGDLANEVQEVIFSKLKCQITWRKKRALYREENWFESIWKDFLSDNIINNIITEGE